MSCENEELISVAKYFDTLIFSNEDVAGMSSYYVKQLEYLSETTVIMTMGEDGSRVIFTEGGQRERIDLPAYSLTEEEKNQIRGKEGVVLTGLGDVFAGAYAFMRGEGDDIFHSALKANIIASLRIREAITGEGGITACPSIERIQEILTNEPERLGVYFRSLENKSPSFEGSYTLIREGIGNTRR